MRTIVVLMLACLLACHPKEKPTTATGTKVLEWSRGPTTLSTGVSIGEDIGGAVADRQTVTFTPTDQRDKSLGNVRISLRVERTDVMLVPNAKGERPAEKAVAPKRLEVTLLENHGWMVSGTCDPSLLGPGAGERGTVLFAQNCHVSLKSGEDTGTIILTIEGSGKHKANGAFGKATIP